MVADPAEGTRLHPITPWRRAWAPIAGFAVFAAQDFNRTREWITQLTLGWLLVAFAVLLPVAALYGFLSWWVTSYRVTDTELRIRTGLLFRRVAHIRLDRIQAVDITRPMLARVAGVAKLKLDVVGTNSKDELAFLGEAEAVALRAELLARAAGIAPESAPDAGEAPESELVRVAPRMLTVGLLLMGSGWGLLAAILLGPVFLWSVTGSVGAALVMAVPMVGGVWMSTIGRYLNEYDWKVAESPDGLRLDHGLLDREHATVPPGRVQAVRVLQPRLWRSRDWVRVELSVAGGDAGSLLLPVAERAVAAQVLARVLPGVDLAEAAAAATPVSRRARWAVPLWWRGYRHGVTDAVFVTRQGLLCREMTLVPHAKVQSVRRTQGPWMRRLGLADVHVDHGANGATTARLRTAGEASEIVTAQAERSRTGRRTAGPERWLTAPALTAPESAAAGTPPTDAGHAPAAPGHSTPS
ncbi:PH domain-containing protein [Streptomyces sp. 549]|uniref:PH domain-containing protein n=1 Tax=Streptomyces sp. 549 TaxID=3049076 RepID=UPI0024C2D1C9|nr:PH domain-containing protein [Streptomyces sp. 549]MDK1472323.1 PH domain-containing protein [Streptomyces sp. 549]